MTHDVTFIPKENITVVSVGDSLEALAVRALLESFNYIVTVHWVGSRKELLKILSGDIETDQTFVLSCHGIKEGIAVPDEPALSAGEVADIAKFTGKTIVNLGCLTGSLEFVQAFKSAGAKFYIAPIDYPEGKAAIGFVSNLFMLLASKVSMEDAVCRASDFDTETEQFKLFA